MNINEIEEGIQEHGETENKSIPIFLSNFKRKTKIHGSLFDNSFTQKVTTYSQTNFKDYKSSKFLEFKLDSSEFLSDLISIP